MAVRSSPRDTLVKRRRIFNTTHRRVPQSGDVAAIRAPPFSFSSFFLFLFLLSSSLLDLPFYLPPVYISVVFIGETDL